MRLPASFELRMKEMLKDEYEAFLLGYDKEHFSGLRLNRLKITPDKWAKINPGETKPIPWIDNGFYIKTNSGEYTHHPYYYAGLYYIQEPSAMTPANILGVTPGDRVLDVCAAPGGKSTELASKLEGKGVLVSNDISNTRAKALVKNLGVFGVTNSTIISEDPHNLVKVFDGYFDKILVDAPCSGEGMFRKDPAIMKNWEQYGTGYYADLQKKILTDVCKMLRPGGDLLYSTCTFSPEEDEGAIEFILDTYPEFEVIDITEKYEGFAKGEPSYINSDKEEIKGTVRIWPHRCEGEGHYVALLHKKGEDFKKSYGITYKKAKLTEEEERFLKKLGYTKDELERTEIHGEKLYLIPEGMPDITGLRILRNGLYLGDRKKNRFEPSQPLAMSLNTENMKAIVSFKADDERVIKYLKCETIDADTEIKDTIDGYVLVCIEGYPLGWGKVSGKTIKNKYFPGWRMM
ncbi:MAG: RsmB/NOP family class I SAM-dependent RNA methyltransferase [Lachnospiraceae bacterium]|nr:RsmB/NOP family class I SAM-dependent RNA methyltransferase [Lachnospiraceae bacterium]